MGLYKKMNRRQVNNGIRFWGCHAMDKLINILQIDNMFIIIKNFCNSTFLLECKTNTIPVLLHQMRISIN
jgi:hypothetical protein